MVKVHINGSTDNSTKVTLRMGKRKVLERTSMQMETNTQGVLKMENIMAWDSISGSEDKFTEVSFDTAYGVVREHNYIQMDLPTLDAFLMITCMEKVASSGPRVTNT